jgi:hypothetical protein
MSDFQSALSFDPSIADIESSLTGGRMIILSAEALRSVEEGLYGKFSTGAAVILLEMGFAYGMTLYRVLEANAKSSPDSDPLTLRYVIQTLFKGGFGRISFMEDTESGKKFSFTVHNCAFCGHDLADNDCNFLRGVLSASVANLLGREYKSSTSCSVDANQNHVCAIELLKK